MDLYKNNALQLPLPILNAAAVTHTSLASRLLEQMQASIRK
jgi:hypothetical protein